MKKLRCNMEFCGEAFSATLDLPDKYFDVLGHPIMHLLDNRFSAHPVITWRQDWQCAPTQSDAVELPPIGDEVQKLREVIDSLQKKFDEVRP